MNGEILTMEQACEAIMRSALLFFDGPKRELADEIMQDANKLRHKVLELERQ